MTTLNKTQYQLTWAGEMPKYNYTSGSFLGGLFNSEKAANDYLDEMVSKGWIVLEASIKEIN